MSSHSWIWTALGVSVIAFVACIWQFVNMRGYKARGHRRRAARASANSEKNGSRRSDKRKLTSSEKKLYVEAKRLLATGKVGAAARIFEQLNMPREAIQALEDAGQIHEAAKILIRMQRHNRAGVIYARHGMWEHAAQCFKTASMPLEVAKCFREAGNFMYAGEYFEKAGRPEDAAICYRQGGDLRRAARLYNQLGNPMQAIQLYSRLAANTPDVKSIQLHGDEVDQIAGYLSEGNTDSELISLLVSTPKYVEVILNLVSGGLIRQATELLAQSPSDIGPQLIADVCYQDQSAQNLTEVFLNNSRFAYAGMVFEHMTAYSEAGAAFEKSGDLERAIYCYERAGLNPHARELKERLKSQGKPVKHSQPYTPSHASSRDPRRKPNAHFALSSIGTDQNTPNASSSSSYNDEAPSEYNEEKEELSDPNPGNNQTDSVSSTGSGHHEAEPTAMLSGEKFVPAFSLVTSEQNKSDSFNNSMSQDPVTSILPPPDEGFDVFQRAKFFDDLDTDQKLKVWSLGKTHDFNQDETILTYNDEPTGVYVIVTGGVSCYRMVGGIEKYVDKMGEADTFGELWLLADQPTAVRFVAAPDTKIRIVERDAFNELLDHDGNIARKLYKRFTMRLLKRLLRPQAFQKNLAAS